LHMSNRRVIAHLFHDDNIDVGANMTFTASHDTVGKLYQATLSDSNSEGGYVHLNLAEDLKTGNLSSHVHNKDIEDLSGTLSTEEDKESGQITYYIGYVYTGSTVEHFIKLKCMPMEKNVTRLDITSAELPIVASRSFEITQNSIFSKDFDMKLTWDANNIWINNMTLETGAMGNDNVDQMSYKLYWNIFDQQLGGQRIIKFLEYEPTDASRIAILTQGLYLGTSGGKLSAILDFDWVQFSSEVMNLKLNIGPKSDNSILFGAVSLPNQQEKGIRLKL